MDVAGGKRSYIFVSTDELMNIVKEGRTVPRKGHTQKRDVLADPIYNNKVVTKLINNIMLDGKRGVAQKIVYGAFDRVAAKTENQQSKFLKKL